MASIGIQVTNNDALQSLFNLSFVLSPAQMQRTNKSVVLPFMKSVVRQNYASEGRPTPWPPLAPTTRAKRDFLGQSGKTLNPESVDPLRRFSVSSLTSDKVAYGSSHPGVVWHDTEVTVKEITNLIPRRKSFLVFPLASGSIVITKLVKKIPRHTIPARPVVGMTRSDAQELSRRIMVGLTAAWNS